jgi:hypothetical protein
MKEVYRTGLLLTLANTLNIGIVGAFGILLVNS